MQKDKHSLMPKKHQKELPLSEIIINDRPSNEKVEFDILFVGAGPASLGGAIKLAKLVKEENQKTGGEIGDISIGVLEKSTEVGQHILSGAVIKPQSILKLFPEIPIEELPFSERIKQEKVYFLTKKRAWRIPIPPPMRNSGNYIASLSEITKWMAKKAESLGIQIFTGFPVKGILVRDNNVIGVRTTETGLDREGKPMQNFQDGTDCTAKVVVLGEGSCGFLSQAYLQWQKITSENPQIYSIGLKELWETKISLESIVHTMGWPLPPDVFGGSFMYPLEKNLIALGLVMGLDYKNASLDSHFLMQQMKTHPLFKSFLKNGQIVEWGAKTIPEGGYYSIPKRLSGDGLLLIGDSAGLVDVPSLKGIHYAILSGIKAAKTILEALKKKNFSAEILSDYDNSVKSSFIVKDLWRHRNMRLGFKDGLCKGAAKAAIMHVTNGRWPGKKISMSADNEVTRNFDKPWNFQPDGKLTFKKADAVYRSGNATRDSIPSHLLIGEKIIPDVAEFYSKICPAGVYEVVDGKLRVNPPNCIDCKATDILAGRWTPREAGSGPKYKRM